MVLEYMPMRSLAVNIRSIRLTVENTLVSFSRTMNSLPSAGSTFKRPTGYYAGSLIEGCGLKGCRVGGAEVSSKHAGFVVNVGGATCADVLALIEKVQKTVYDAHGVMLEPEVKIIR